MAQLLEPESWLQQDPGIEYKQLELLGKGSFGSVYKCLRVQDGRLVAMKSIEIDSTQQLSVND